MNLKFRKVHNTKDWKKRKKNARIGSKKTTNLLQKCCFLARIDRPPWNHNVKSYFVGKLGIFWSFWFIYLVKKNSKHLPKEILVTKAVEVANKGNKCCKS